MGNQLAPAAKPGVSLETQGELLNVVVRETLGGGRFLKSLLCLHDNGGLVVVKVFYKRKDATSLAPYRQQLQAIRDALLGLECPHVWPMQLWWETPNAAYMMRQHFVANMYDRLSTRPFLTQLEKRWITFQLLHGLSQAHAHGVGHGDIKCENVMLTSWNWLFLTDFASYKPTYLPADNPADFSYYFDTGSRRRCYLAPERFFEGSAAAINTAAPLQQDMDIFSLGCVIAELWLDGRAFFDLSQLLAYRRGEYDPTMALAGVAPDIAELVMHMIQRAPGGRWSADHYLTSWPRQLFPSHFSEALHPFFNSLLWLEPDARLAAVAAHHDELAAAVCQTRSNAGMAQVNEAPAGARPVAVTSGTAAAGAGRQAGSHLTRVAYGAAGGTSSAAVARPSAGSGSELLAEVDHLLADVGGMQGRLTGAIAHGTSTTAAEDDGICIDESSLMSAEVGSTKNAGSFGAEPDESQTGHHQPPVVTEQWYEYQVRDPTNQWTPSTLPTSSSSVGLVTAQAASKDDVSLPAKGGWCWLGPWQLQASGGSYAADVGSSVPVAGTAGADGWQYALPGADGRIGWGPQCTEQSQQRRRCWVRQCRKQSNGTDDQVVTSTEPGAIISLSAGVQASDSWPGSSCDQGMVLLAVLLCTLLRGSKLQESKRAAIMLLFRSALLCDDEVRLQTVVPYLLTQLSDASANVRTLALRCVVQVMASLARLPPADAKVYHDYILPSLSLLPHDSEESVRVAYALAVAHLAAAAHEHLLGMQYGSSNTTVPKLAAAGTAVETASITLPSEHSSKMLDANSRRTSRSGRMSSSDDATDQPAHGSDAGAETLTASVVQQAAALQQPLVRYDAEMAAVRGAVEKVVLELVTGTRSSADIKRGLLSHAHQLGIFFGRRDINDLLLPLLITCLNAGEWQLRGSFFGAIASVGPHTGRDSLDVFLLPCLEQALVDGETAVVSDAVRCLAAVCSYLRKRSLLAAANKVAPLLQHHSAAVRCSAVAFITAAARALPAADVYTQLSVMVAGFLQQQPLMFTDEEHLAACLHSADPGTQLVSPGAVIPWHTTGDRRSSTGSGSLSPRTLSTELNLEGSELLLRPAAPVYCMDIDPAVLSDGATAAASAGIGSTLEATPPAVAGLQGHKTAGPGLLGQGARCGYRPGGFAAQGSGSNSRLAATASIQAVSSGQASLGHATNFAVPQNSTLAPRPLATPAGHDAAMPAAAAVVRPNTAEPGNFWSGSSASRNGLNTPRVSRRSLGVGPGGLPVGPVAAGQGAGGLRPRPKSSHTAAVESISKRRAALQERYDRLLEALARDPTGVEAGERQQLERLAATLHRLNLQAGDDVRSPAALLTYKMAAITTRAGPTGAASGPQGDAAATPAVYDAVSAALATGIGQHLPGLDGGAAGPSWRPRGVLSSHLQEHRAAVNCLAASSNGALLFSGSDDETVKVWDVRRLERDVAFASRLTYAGQSGRITGLCPTMDGATVASGSSSGSLHVWRVEYNSKPGSWTPDKYRGITAVRQLSPGEGAILKIVPWGPHPALLLYATQRGGVHCCDLRAPADVWHVPAAPSLGLCQQLLADPTGQHWFAQGTSRGWVCLWDVRFLLCVNSWQHPHRCSVDAMAPALAAAARLGLSSGSLPHPSAPLLYMAAGNQEVGVWDALNGQCHQVLRVLNREESHINVSEPPAALQPPLPANSSQPKVQGGLAAAAVGSSVGGLGLSSSSSLQHGTHVNQVVSELSTHLAVDQINSPRARLAGVTALLPLPGGALLTGGADRCVRYWDGSWPERSYIVAGPVWPDDTAIMEPNTNKLQVPSHVYRYSKRLVSGVPVLEERCVGDGPRLVTPDSSPSLSRQLRMQDLVHSDTITQLLAVEGTSKLLVSASRDGCIKVWK